MLGATLWLAVAATSATVCASWGLAQALAKMKESVTKGFMLTLIFTSHFSRHKLPLVCGGPHGKRAGASTDLMANNYHLRHFLKESATKGFMLSVIFH